MKIIKVLLIVLILFLTLVPRSAEVLSGNFLFGFDQGRDYLAVKNIVVDGKLTLIGSEIGAGVAGFKGIFHGPFHFYFLAIPFILANGNPYGGIVLTFLYGVLIIVLGFLLGKRLFGNFGGFLVTILIALSPPLISASRFVWNSHGAPVFILLAFYCVYMISRESKKEGRYTLGAGFFSAFIYNFQLSIAIPMVIALLLFFVLILRAKNIKQYLLLILGIGMGFAPMIFFEIRHDFMALRGLFDYVFNPGKTVIALRLVELNGHLGAFLFNIYDAFPRQNMLAGELIAIPLGLLVFYFLRREKKDALKRFVLYLLILPFTNFIVLFFLRNLVYQYYLLNLTLSYIILFSYVCFSSYKHRKRLLLAGFVFLVIILFVQNLSTMIRTFKNDYLDYGGTAKIKGKIDAIDYIYKDAKGKKFGLLVFSPPVYTYPYDYIIWWHGEKKYKFIPYKEKRGLFYLLIEPDPSKPWSYKGWLETVIKTGKIIETKELPNGFIIQKRIEKDEGGA